MMLPEEVKEVILHMDFKQHPSVWERVLGITVLDSDGWKDIKWETPITQEDFLDRVRQCTCEYGPGYFDKPKL